MASSHDVDPSDVHSVAEFADCLRRMRARSDGTSYRALEHWGRRHNKPLPRSTLVDVLAGRRLPRKAMLLALLEACGVDPARDPRWVHAWNRLSDKGAAAPATGATAAHDAVHGEIAQLRADAHRQVDQMYADAARDIRQRRISARLGADIRAAGLRRIGANYLPDLDWDRLFADAEELDIFVAYGQTWRNLHAPRLHRLCARPSCRVRVFLPDTNDTRTMSVLADRFAITPDEVAARIDATRHDYTQMRRPGGAQIDIYYRPGDRLFSFYRLSNTVIVGFYSHSGSRTSSVPAFVCAAPGSLYQFVADELSAIEQQSRPAPD